MEVEIVRDATRLGELSQDWDQLERAVSDAGEEPGGTYYLSHRFVSAWWWSHQSEPGFELAVLVLRHNGAVVGIAPLATVEAQRAGQPVTRLRFATHGDYLGFLIDPEAPHHTVVKNLLSALETQLTWQSARLGGILVHSSLGQHLLRSDEHNTHFTLHVENPHIDLTQISDFAQFQERLPKHTRKWRNRLSRDHPELTFRVLAGNAEDIFERIGQVHRAERDHLITTQGRTERHSLFDDRARWGHYYRVFTTTDDTRTFVLEAPDGTLAGYRTTFRDDRRLLSWNGAYHPQFADYRIGSVLLHDMVAHLFETRDVDVLDLGAGRYPWKFSWTPDFRSTYELRLERDLPQRAPDTRVVTGHSGVSAAKVSDAEAGVPTVPTAPVDTVSRGSAARTTYVISPHPDDETLRATGLLTSQVPGDDERFVLVAVTDGGNSSRSQRRGWTPEQEQAIRTTEQVAAWAALTGGRGSIIRLGVPDEALTTEAVVTALRAAVPGILEPGAFVVVAAHGEDYHEGHRAVVRAVRELAPTHFATSLAPLMKDPADPAHLLGVSRPAPERASAARIASHAYREFGQRSVPPEFEALAKQGYRSRLTDPNQVPQAPVGAHGRPLPRVLVLGGTRDQLRSAAPDAVVTDADLAQAWHVTWAAGTAPGVAPDAQDVLVEPITADPHRIQTAEPFLTGPGRAHSAARRVERVVRKGASAAGGALEALRAARGPEAAGGDWATTLRNSRRARLLFAETDLILSTDAETDAALPQVGTVARVVPSAHARAVLAAGREVAALLSELTDADIAAECESEEQFTARLSQWTQQAHQASPALAVAPELTRTWAGVWLQVAEVHEPQRVARIRAAVLEALPWERTGPGAALRAALALDAVLTMAETSTAQTPAVSTTALQVARDALAAADEAMTARRNRDSLDHLSAAMRVLFHPVLHTDWATSPLVKDSTEYLASLWSARSFRTLLDREKALSPWGERLLQSPAAGPGEVPAEATERSTGLVIREGEADGPALGGSVPAGGSVPDGPAPALGLADLDRHAVIDLAGLIGSQHRRPRFGQSQPPAHQRTKVWALSAQLLNASHVQADGLGRTAVWVSHLCPPTTSLVVALSMANITSPWLHLMRWDRVHEVVAENEAGAALVREILAGLGADVPVRVEGHSAGR